MALSTIPTRALSEQGINFRNLIINGDMSIAQRGTSATGVGTSYTYFTVDRFKLGGSGASSARFTMSQVTDTPTGQGFGYSTKFDCTTADTSLGASDQLAFIQGIEGQNLQMLKKGTSSAESLTLSFWVKSNKTGTYIAELRDTDNSRTINKSYTINSANTWEKKTITYDGDTTGVFSNDNGESLRLIYWLFAGTDFTSGTLQTSWGSATNANRAVGQVNFADSTSNEWYITGVQLEVGTTASDFEFLPYDVNLRRCKRYYQLIASGNDVPFGMGTYYSNTNLYNTQKLSPTMRATPSLDIVSGTDYYVLYNLGGNGIDNMNSLTFDVGSDNFVNINNSTEVNSSAGQSGIMRTKNSNSYLAFSSEL